MVFEIEVFDDGDVYVTKRLQEPEFPTLLYLHDYERLKKELIDYGVEELEEDILEIQKADFDEPVKCY
jgi:hypothetical protein